MRLAFSILDLAARLLFALGAGCLLLGVYLSWQTLSFARDAVRTTGEVVSYREIHEQGATRYQPAVRFETASGEIVKVEGQLATQSRRFEIGERVPLIYKVSEPTRARIASFTDNWLGACVAAVVGLVGLAGGFLVRRGVRRELAKLRP